MKNPFETIDARLTNIECLLLDFKHAPVSHLVLPLSDRLLTIKQAGEFISWPVQSIYGFLCCTAEHCIDYYLNGNGKNLRKHRKKSNLKKNKRFPKPGKLLKWLIKVFFFFVLRSMVNNYHTLESPNPLSHMSPPMLMSKF